MRSGSIAVVTATLWAITPPCIAQSFDCRVAKTPDEVAICTHPYLSNYDKVLSKLYSESEKTVSGQYLRQLKVDQLEWLRQRRACGSDVSCIAKLYISRSGYLAGGYLGPEYYARPSQPSQPDYVNPVAQPESQPTDMSLVPIQSSGGTFSVPVQINGAITLYFVIDSGASDVSIPADVVLTLMRTGTLTSADFLGRQTYILADGSTVPSQRFTIRSLKVGDRTLQNVTGSVAPVKGGLLLGQSFLSRFNSWSIDNGQHVLVLK